MELRGVDLGGPEVALARTIGVVLAERVLVARTRLVTWALGAGAALLLVLTVLAGDWLAVLLGVLCALVLGALVAVLVVRWVAVRALRRIGGGPSFAIVRPLVERRMDDVLRVATSVPRSRVGAAGVALSVRDPNGLEQRVRTAGDDVVRLLPDLLAEVRAALARR